VGRLTDLVERLLDVSRIVQGRLSLQCEETDLGAVVRQVADDVREEALRVGSTLSVSAPASLPGHWDRARLEQILLNLLSNALKYGGGKPVEIFLEDLGDGARLSVKDYGIGIAAEDHERIFGRFERAAPTRHYGGLGLGLYVTRSIVEAHGGVIGVESRRGEGATFIVDLPRDAREKVRTRASA
jgi:signal transduction histidine kinase